MEHSRHRSFPGFIVNTIAAFIAYSFFPKKPAIKYQSVKANQIVLFQNRTPVIREKERTQLASGENKSKKSPFP